MRVLGLDLGSFSVKAVEIDSAFGRYEILEYHEQPVAPGGTAAEAARTLLAGLSRPPDRVVVAVRTVNLTFRNLNLPTRDRKAIQAGVGFELEDDLPFPSDEALHDYVLLSQQRQGSHVHVAVTLKRHLEALLANLRSGSVDPDAVTAESWGMRGLLNRALSGPIQDKPVMVLNVGHQRTLVYVHWRGFPILSREIPWGGKQITDAISAKYGIPWERAERSKIDNGFILPHSQREKATPEQLEFSNVFWQALAPHLREIRQAELTAKAITHQSLSGIYLSGGSSLIPGLPRALEESFGVSVKPLQALSAVATSGVSYSEHTDSVFGLALALALSGAGLERAGTINFRKGAYAKASGQAGFTWAAAKKPAIAFASVLGCLYASVITQSVVFKKRLVDADVQLERSIKNVFPAASKSAMRTYLANPKSLKDAVTQEVLKSKEIAKLSGLNPGSPLHFVKELSQAVDRDTIVDLVELKVGASPETVPSSDGKVSLVFWVASPQVAEKLSSVLTGGKLGRFERTQIEEVTVGDAGEKRWKVGFSGTPDFAKGGAGHGR